MNSPIKEIIVESEEKALLDKVEALGLKDDETRNGVVCAMIGHSRINTHCFGYYYCARCNAQVGDTLGSIYVEAERAVIVGHDCEICRKNYAELSWKDKLFTPYPFQTEPKP